MSPTIPDWDIQGVIPPVRPNQEENSPDRSPYLTSVYEMCKKFGNTSDRRKILRGFVKLRTELRSAGLTKGFQWVNGSFIENVETEQNRSPNDVDVVTFMSFGNKELQEKLITDHPYLFNPKSRQNFHVDHYFINTDKQLDSKQARKIAYWYSMWSHRRGDNSWKGFVEVFLDTDDKDAEKWLSEQDKETSSEEASDES